MKNLESAFLEQYTNGIVGRLEEKRLEGGVSEISIAWQLMQMGLKNIDGGYTKDLGQTSIPGLFAYLGVSRVAQVAEQTIAAKKLSTGGMRKGLLFAREILRNPIKDEVQSQLRGRNLSDTERVEFGDWLFEDFRDAARYCEKVHILTGADWALQARVDLLNRALNKLSGNNTVRGRLVLFEHRIAEVHEQNDFDDVAWYAEQAMKDRGEKKVTQDQKEAVSKWHWNFLRTHDAENTRLVDAEKAMDEVMGPEKGKKQRRMLVMGGIAGLWKKVGYDLGADFGMWKNDEFKIE